MQRSDIERIAGEALAAPGDFWLSENSVADYVDPETGTVDYDRVQQDAQVLLADQIAAEALDLADVETSKPKRCFVLCVIPMVSSWRPMAATPTPNPLTQPITG